MCYRNDKIPVSIPLAITVMRGNNAPLTGDRDRHIKKWPIPRNKVNYLNETPLRPPDVLDFPIEKDEPIVHLVRIGRPHEAEQS